MVSIVDWSRLSRLGVDPNPTKPEISLQLGIFAFRPLPTVPEYCISLYDIWCVVNLQADTVVRYQMSPNLHAEMNRYRKLKEAEVIKDAEESGYFFRPLASFLKESFLHAKDEETNNNAKKTSLQEILFIRLENFRIRDLGAINQCSNIRICILSNNYLCKIEALDNCPLLIKLDLHANQICNLPGARFWSNLIFLKLLYLHDNPIGRIADIHSLAACSNLVAMTLFDTPLSLMNNYRHHVVNSIWSLKALDYYVISDEEIIEDAQFGDSFAPFTREMELDLCSSVAQGAEFEDELQVVYNVISEVNRILAHNSPVTIMQRYIRGFIIRRKYVLVRNTRAWAAATIQRNYRTWKKLPTPLTFMQPSSPVPLGTPIPPPAPPSPVGNKIDYDSYERSRKSASKHSTPSAISSTYLDPPGSPVSGTSDIYNYCKNHPLHVSLDKLQKGSMKIKKIHFSSGLKNSYRAALASKSMDQGAYVYSDVTMQNTGPDGQFSEEHHSYSEMPATNFRLRGLKQEIKCVDPTADLIIARREAGLDIREAEAAHHAKVDKERITAIVPHRKKMITMHQKMFSRLQGTMGLSCLQAVNIAYKERERAERQAIQSQIVLSAKDAREMSTHRIKMYKKEKRASVMRNRQRDHARTEDVIERRETRVKQHLEFSNQKRQNTANVKSNRKNEQVFLRDFSVQNTSVSKALMRHDRLTGMEETTRLKTELVLERENDHKTQKEIVRKYMEHRQQMRQMDSALSRSALKTRAIQEANDRLLEAQWRVAQKKALSAHVHQSQHDRRLYEHTHLFPVLPNTQVQDLTGMDRWYTSLAMVDGRIGKHHPTLPARSRIATE